MKLILLIFSAYLLESFVVRSDTSGYFWKDYYGEIPDDAFPGGEDLNGDPVYIGQSLSGEYLVPSKIYGSTKKVYFELGNEEHEGTKQVKILCSEHPEQLAWIQTDNEKIKVLTDAHLIIGGYDPAWTIYIGRVRSNGEILVGKVGADNPSGMVNTGYWGTSNGKVIRSSAYDVLSFNKTAPPLLDIRYDIKKINVEKLIIINK